MKINFSHDSKEFIFKLKSHISKDNPSRARQYTAKLISRITDMLQYPNSVVVLMIYRYIDFDESSVEIE